MARLLIHFYTDELAEFRWASIDEAQQTADIDWQPATEDELDRSDTTVSGTSVRRRLTNR